MFVADCPIGLVGGGDLIYAGGMKILALDTAATVCAAAIYDAEAGRLLSQVSETIGKGHAEVLMAYVEKALLEAAIDIADIDRIAVNVGPGSFTGVRIAVSAARGFALALNCPAVGVTAFEALAFEAQTSFGARPVMVMLDAHRGEIYTQSFAADGAACAAPEAISLDEAIARAGACDRQTVLTGSASVAVNEALGGIFDLGRAAVTGHIETFAQMASLRQPGEAPKPLYLRGPDAKPQTGFALPRQSDN